MNRRRYFGLCLCFGVMVGLASQRLMVTWSMATITGARRRPDNTGPPIPRHGKNKKTRRAFFSAPAADFFSVPAEDSAPHEASPEALAGAGANRRAPAPTASGPHRSRPGSLHRLGMAPAPLARPPVLSDEQAVWGTGLGYSRRADRGITRREPPLRPADAVDPREPPNNGHG